MKGRNNQYTYKTYFQSLLLNRKKNHVVVHNKLFI